MTTTTRTDVWRLDAQTSWLADAAGGVRALSTAAGSAGATTSSVTGQVACAWEGTFADSYLDYAPTVTAGLDELSAMGDQIRTTLTAIEDRVQQLRTDLDASYGRATTGMTSVTRGGGVVTFEYPDDEDRPQIAQEFTRAQTLVQEARSDLTTSAGTLRGVAEAAETLAQQWQGPANGNPRWTVPLGGGFAPQTTTLGSTTTVTTGTSATTVEVRIDPETGETVLVLTYDTDSACVREEIRIPAGQDVVITTGQGNDRIVVGPGVDVRLRFATGRGSDTIEAQGATGRVEAFTGSGDDTVETGAGHDFIDAGAGHDYVDAGDGADRIFGGTGNDVLYGMGGDDVISGGGGNDYLEGGRGDDLLLGDEGHDTLSGGLGDDRILGGSGDDTLYAGGGTDILDGGSGTDKVTLEEGDTQVGGERTVIVEIPPEDYYTQWLEFEVDGSDAFKERMLADLQMLASSEAGQAMIEAQIRNYENSGGLFGIGKRKVTFIEMSEPNGYATPEGDVKINPDFRMGIANASAPNGHTHTPPVVILFHELGHINQLRTQGDTFDHWWDPDAVKADGTKGDWIRDENDQPLLERQNVGLSWDPDLIPEGNGEDYDFTLTENGFRREIGLPGRERY